MRKLVLLLCLLCCGCFDYNDASSTLIVSSIGFDYQDNNYIFYYYLINPQTLTTSELGSSSVDTKFSIAKIENKNFHDAWNSLLLYSNENISAAHLQSVILTENFCKEKLDELLIIIKSAPWYYPDFKIFVTEDKIDEIFKSENPENISPYFSIIGEFSNDKIYNYTTYSQFAAMISENLLSPRFPIISIDKDIWENNKGKLTSIAYNGLIYYNDKRSSIKITRDQFQVIDLVAKKNDITLVYNNVAYKLDNIKIKRKYENGLKITILGDCEVVNHISLSKNQYQNILIENMTNEFISLINYGILNEHDIFSINDFLYRNKKDNVYYQNVVYNIDIKLSFNF